MQLSARNQLSGMVPGLKSGAVMAGLTVSIEPGLVTAAITDSSRERLNLIEGPVVLFLPDPQAVPSWWLHHYFPATARLEASRKTPLGQVARMLAGRLDVIPVPIPAGRTDGFNAAYTRRPRAYLDPQIWRPMSALALIPETDRADGMVRRPAGPGDDGRSR